MSTVHHHPSPQVPGSEWDIHTHPVLFDTFYHDVETNEVTWDRPKVLGPEWFEYWDTELKLPYWKSIVTEQASVQRRW